MPPAKPCSSRSRSKIRFAVCCAALCKSDAKGNLLPDYYSGATGIPGRFSEGLLLRRFQLGNGRADRSLVFEDATCKRCDQTRAGGDDPWFEFDNNLLADHGLEPFDEGARVYERGTRASMAAMVTVSALLR